MLKFAKLFHLDAAGRGGGSSRSMNNPATVDDSAHLSCSLRTDLGSDVCKMLAAVVATGHTCTEDLVGEADDKLIKHALGLEPRHLRTQKATAQALNISPSIVKQITIVIAATMHWRARAWVGLVV